MFIKVVENITMLKYGRCKKDPNETIRNTKYNI